jgi:hypothetical protein
MVAGEWSLAGSVSSTWERVVAWRPTRTGAVCLSPGQLYEGSQGRDGEGGAKMTAEFSSEGARLELTRKEYIFVYLSMSYVLHGAHFEDHDFMNILGMSREDAELLMESIAGAEKVARQHGEHWNPQVDRGE